MIMQTNEKKNFKKNLEEKFRKTQFKYYLATTIHLSILAEPNYLTCLEMVLLPNIRISGQLCNRENCNQLDIIHTSHLFH